jgi:5-methylcytosine-specific restriction enzyme A
VLDRDRHRCVVCGATARLEVDHIEPGDDHSLANLRTVCTRCHLRKSAAEGGRAKARKYQRLREPERHPGLRAP